MLVLPLKNGGMYTCSQIIEDPEIRTPYNNDHFRSSTPIGGVDLMLGYLNFGPEIQIITLDDSTNIVNIDSISNIDITVNNTINISD